MAFKLNDDQTALRDALRDFLNEQITSEYRRARADGVIESDPELWKGFQSLGLFELFDAAGETGVGELAIVAHEIGRAVAPESLVDALVAGPFLINQLLSAEAREVVRAHVGGDFIEGISSGDVRVGLGLNNGNSGAGLSVRGHGEAVRIDGRLRYIGAPSDVDGLIVADSTGLLLCDLRTGKEQQVDVTPTPLIDGTMKAGELDLKNVEAVRLAGCGTFGEIVRVLRAAEMSGAVSRAIEMTVDYVKTRKQFGVPVGGFQAVQHKLADMYANAEALRALTLFAAWSADHSEDQLPLAAQAACHFACDVSGEIIEGAIQLHGGIGFTWEYDLHYFLRRVKALEALYQPTDGDTQALIGAVRQG